jgi:hypothetical protein
VVGFGRCARFAPAALASFGRSREGVSALRVPVAIAGAVRASAPRRRAPASLADHGAIAHATILSNDKLPHWSAIASATPSNVFAVTSPPLWMPSCFLPARLRAVTFARISGR